MDHPLLSLVTPPPPGFLHRTRLEGAEVRRGVFALFAPTAGEAERALAPWAGKLNGLIITPERATACARLPSGLWHLGLTAGALGALAEWLPPLLGLLEDSARQADRQRALAWENERLSADRVQAAGEFATFRSSLLTEIAERRQTEEALRLSEQRFRTIFNSVNDAIFLHDPDNGSIFDVNQRACELFGYPPEELKRLHIEDLSANEPDFRQDQALLRIRHAAREPQMFNWHSRHRSGRLFWSEVNMRKACILDRPCIIVTVRDVTERREAEENRRLLETQLMQTQKLESLGVMAGGIAHDFNNLLLAILGNLDLATATMAPTAPALKHLDEIECAARRAAELCRQMLSYAGKDSLMPQMVHLPGLVREMGRMIEVSIPRKVLLRYDMPETLPAVHGDATQLRQIVLNLILNAAEAIGEASGTVAVRAGTLFANRALLASTFLGPNLPEGTYLYLEVEDTGCGMDEETRKRVFDPFFSTKFTGRGLGLATVFGIVRSHQGAIQLESEPGRGTRFRILFPTIDEQPGQPPPPTTAQRGPAWRGEGVILLVDDDEAVRNMIRLTLQQLGFEVLAARDGVEAVEIFDSSAGASIRCAVIDLTMPRMDGAETFRQLRDRRPNLPAIISSGYSEREVAPHFAGCSGVNFLHKPYHAGALRDLLQELLRSVPGHPAS